MDADRVSRGKVTPPACGADSLRINDSYTGVRYVPLRVEITAVASRVMRITSLTFSVTRGLHCRLET